MKTSKEDVIMAIKSEMRWFVSMYADGRYESRENLHTELTRLFGFTQGICSVLPDCYDYVSELWETFRTDIYVWCGVYKVEAWKDIDGVFSERI